MILKLKYRPTLKCVLFLFTLKSAFLLIFVYSNYYYYPYGPTVSQHDEDSVLLNAGRDLVLPEKEVLLPTVSTGKLEPLDGRWQNVSDSKSMIFVFSAHHDRRPNLPRSIRVIAAVKMNYFEPVWCIIRYKTGASKTVSVVPKIIRENWNRPYTASFIICPLSDDMLVPHSVSIVSKLNSVPSNRLLVVDNYQLRAKNDNMKSTTTGKLSVCVKPLYTFNENVHLIEFFEMYSLLGVEHFTIYNNNTDPGIDCILKDYVAQGRVTLLPWDLKLSPGQDIWVQGIHAALNDCLLRNLYRYSNVAMVDLDEFIVPTSAHTLVQMIDHLDKTYSSNNPIGAYVFQNAFFFRAREDDSSVTKSFESQLLTISKTSRDVEMLPHTIRSKYICRPELTLETGNHFVWEYVSNDVNTVNVDHTVAKSHHYRACYDWLDCTKENTVIDRSIYRYRNEVLANVLKKWNVLRTNCGLSDESHLVTVDTYNAIIYNV